MKLVFRMGYLAGLLVWSRPTHAADYTVVERGPHHRVWEQVVEAVDALGRRVSSTQRYVELETGMHYLQDRQWLESVEEIEVAKNSAVVRHGQQKVTFASDLATSQGGVLLAMDPDLRLRFGVIGLAYFDAQSGKDALIAIVKSSVAELSPPNRLVYRDAFDGLKADVVYTYRRSGLEQDVILREAPPPPELYGLASDTTRLEVLTEFFESPSPVKRLRLLAPGGEGSARALMAEPDWTDEELDFGAFRIGQGRAFSLEESSASAQDAGRNQWTIGKHWDTIAGRTILFESAWYAELRPALERLPAAPSAPPARRAKRFSRWSPPESQGGQVQLSASGLPSRRDWRSLPALRARSAQVSPPSIGVAQARIHQDPGLVLDFVTTIYSSSSFTFEGNTTYLVKGSVNLAGTTTLEGGSVIKYDPSAGTSPQIVVAGPWICRTQLYQPAVFTAKDDNTVGEIVSGSTGNPGNDLYAYEAIHFQNPGAAIRLEHVTLRHALYGIVFDTGASNMLRHAQLVHSYCPVRVVAGGALTLHNLLIDQTSGPAILHQGCAIRGEHLTLHQAAELYRGDRAPAICNSLLVGVTAVPPYQNESTREFPLATEVFQTVGAGRFYLATGGDCRNAGTPQIQAELADDLKQLTTEPPLVWSNDFTVPTILYPQARRDVDQPDLGYHYAPLDYCWTALNLENTSLTLTNGVAIGLFGAKGIILKPGSRFLSEGRPFRLNRLVRYHTVQEQSTNTWANPATALSLLNVSSLAVPWPEVRMRFTEISFLADAGHRRNVIDSAAYLPLASVRLADCQLHKGNWSIYPSQPGMTVHLANNVLDESILYFYQDSIPGYSCFTLNLFNNLFFKGSVSVVYNADDSAWTVRDNLFDRVTLSQGSRMVQSSHNAYCRTSSLGGSANRTLSSCDYQVGKPGEFYYPETGTGLNQLVNAGSRTADLAGLYHHTTRLAAFSLETNSIVDIGFHYVGIDAANQPLDTDADGTPNLGEDLNGNGWVDAGETDWTVSNHDVSAAMPLILFTPLDAP